MKELLRLLSSIFGDKLDAEALLKLAMTLGPIAWDLKDDGQLSPGNRLKIQDEAEALLEKIK